jgi:hypothetical protein
MMLITINPALDQKTAVTSARLHFRRLRKLDNDLAHFQRAKVRRGDIELFAQKGLRFGLHHLRKQRRGEQRHQEHNWDGGSDQESRLYRLPSAL